MSRNYLPADCRRRRVASRAGIGLRRFLCFAPVGAALIFFCCAGQARAAFVADSVIDFSGQQGLAGWSYGQSASGFSAMNVYATTAFFGTDYDYRWYFSGFANDVTWWNTGGHPSPNVGNTFNALRRFVVPETGPITISGIHGKRDTGGGNGVQLNVNQNGVSIYSKTLAFNEANSSFSIPSFSATIGDTIDLSINRIGTDGGSDATNFQALIRSSDVNVLARSFQEFSGVQGQDNWRYGFYDPTTDGSGPGYNPNSDFTLMSTFTSNSEHFSFGDNKWTDVAPPSNVGLYEEGGHPGSNGATGVQTIRRWTSDVSGAITIEGILAKLDPGGGDGITGSILLNGASIYSQAVAFNNLAGFAYSVSANVSIGDHLDFVIDRGADEAFDNSRFTALIYQEAAAAVPEPSTWILAALGLLGLGLVAWRSK